MITEEIIKKAQEGSNESFTLIYNETIKTAYYVAKRILIDEDATEDVLQEAYIAVFKNISTYQTGNLQGWIDTIVANRAKNYLRKKNPVLFSEMETEERPVVEFEEEKIEFRPDEKIDYDETKRLVLEIIDNLSSEQRLSVVLFYFENKSVKEIAEICECSENTVKSRLNYARKSIKEDVLELEKKGTKLYSVSIMPFIIWMLTENAKAAVVTADTTAKILSNASSAVATGEGVSGAILGATSKTVITKAGMALGTKIAIGVATAVITTGTIVGVVAIKNNGGQKEAVVVTSATQNEISEHELDTDENTESSVEGTKEEENKEYKIIKTMTKRDGIFSEYYEYDKNGNEIKYIKTNESTGEVFGNVERVYDENGKLLKVTDYINWHRTAEYIYDKYGSLIFEKPESDYDGYIKTYEIQYDDDARKTYVVYKDERGEDQYRDEYSYYVDGTIKQHISRVDFANKTIIDYDEKGKFIRSLSYNENGMVEIDRQQEYDDDGNILSEKSFGGEYDSQIIYTYDDEGKQLKKQMSDSRGVSSTTEYLYNEDGNVIKEIIKDKDGGSTEIEYTYTYFEE